MHNLITEILQNNQTFVDTVGKDFFEDHLDSQSPDITLITCSDSRVQVEAFEKNAFNKCFVIRNIGNQIFSSEGSVDYGILHLKTPILLILGHTDCGAVKAYLKGYKNETKAIVKELDNLIPALDSGENNLMYNIIQNINFQVNIAINKYSDLINESKLIVVGAMYDFRNELKQGFGKLVLININGESQPY